MKILFVFHEARLTGAPIALYSLVNWLSKNTDYKISFLILDGGELTPKLKEIGEVYKWQVNYIPFFPLLNRVINRIINITESSLIKQLNKQHFDIIYFNTILCSKIINKMSCIKAIKVWHIHELEIAISVFGKNRINSSKHVNCFIANSNSTKSNLIKNGISESKIKVFYPTINQEEICKNSLITINDQSFLNKSHFVIGTSGYVVNRKGLKEFLLLTKTIDQLLPKNNFTFIWVGTIINRLKIYFLNNKYKNRVHFIGAKPNPFPYYNMFDIYVSCSHEESFGLSAVEAAVLKKPIICFKNTGGIEEITKKANNITVSKFNIEEMAKKIIELYQNKIKRIELGNNAKEMASDFDINKNGQQFLNILENVVSKNS